MCKAAALMKGPLEYGVYHLMRPKSQVLRDAAARNTLAHPLAMLKTRR